MKKVYKSEAKNDIRGSLIPFETGKEIPFSIKRVFFLCDMPVGTVRGNHANMNGESIVILVSGEAIIRLIDINAREEEILQKPGEYIYVPVGMWIEIINMDSKTVLCVCSSNYYKADDYASDFEQYISRKRGDINV